MAEVRTIFTSILSPDIASRDSIVQVTLLGRSAMTLDNDQLRAATCDARVQVVKAGPGSGKTQTLVARVRHLIEHGVDPKTIVALTFSRRAAGEIADRLRDVTGPRVRVASTFHSFALRILERDPNGMTEIERNASVRELHERLDDDAMVRARALAYTHLLVDEFQDADRAERMLADFFVDRRRSVWVIGDHDQSIYSFRTPLDDPLQAFLTRNAEVTVHQLTSNYRSKEEIIQVANALLSRRSVRVTAHAHGDVVQRKGFSDPTSEARYVVEEAKGILSRDPKATVAILYRINTYFNEPLLAALGTAQLEFTKFGDQNCLAEVGDDVLSRELDPLRGGLICSSIHAFKGREADHVFVVGVQEKIIPYKLARSPARIEEERRILYVAMTRARQSLTLTWATNGAKKSRFIDDACVKEDVNHPVGTRIWLAAADGAERVYELGDGASIGPDRKVGVLSRPGRILLEAAVGSDVTLMAGAEWAVVRIDVPAPNVPDSSYAA